MNVDMIMYMSIERTAQTTAKHHHIPIGHWMQNPFYKVCHRFKDDGFASLCWFYKQNGKVINRIAVATNQYYCYATFAPTAMVGWEHLIRTNMNKPANNCNKCLHKIATCKRLLMSQIIAA